MAPIAFSLQWHDQTVMRPGPPQRSRDGQISLVAEARIDNRAELHDLLGTEALTGSDAELILAAYERWGTRSAEHLIGDFAFVLHDRRARRVYAACDPMQMRVLYHAAPAGRICIASTAAALAELVQATPVADPVAIAAWLAGRPDPNRSMFTNLARLPAGHCLVADQSGVRTTPFWDIDPDHRIRYARTHDYRDHLTELLRRCVSDRLRSSAAVVSAQLSGGMDSTSVCALATDVLHAAGRPLVALSHVYQASHACDETERIEATARHLGIASCHWLPAETHIHRDFRALYPPVLDSPGTVCSPRYRDELALVRELGADVMLTGSGGDEMVWGHSLTYTQRLRRGDLGVIAEVARGTKVLGLPLMATLTQLFVRPMVPRRMLDARRRLLGRPPPTGLPDWLPQQAIRSFDLDPVLFPVSDVAFDNPALQARYDALRHTSTFNSVRSYEAVAREFHVEVRHPFFDRRLAEFSFAIPDDLWIREAYPKWLLRKVMDGRLPDAVVWNRQKVTFNRFFGSVIASQADNIRGILSDTRLQDMGLLDNARLLAAFDRVVASGGARLNVDLLYALLTQIWFQEHAEGFSIR